jgi:hypothetical protein
LAHLASLLAAGVLAYGCSGRPSDPRQEEKSLSKDAYVLQLLREESDAAIAADAAGDASRRPVLLGELSAGEVAEADLSPSQRYVGWTVVGREGVAVRVEVGQVDADGVDPVALLYRANPDGQPFGPAVAFDDDGGDGLDAVVELRLPETRRYAIIVRAFDISASGRVFTVWSESDLR